MENKEEITKDEEEIVEEFKELNIVGSRFFVKEEDTKIEHFPAKALILNVTSGCNLSCTYCYKADLTSLKNGGQMTFEIAKNAIEENKAIKQSKKERIKNILMKAGYDPTIHYTRKEKKKFTRMVKNSLFTKSPKPGERSKAEWKELFTQQKAAKEVH
jgi:sulfatase maturation enzyme AslB (radical SAM superfamily)